MPRSAPRGETSNSARLLALANCDGSSAARVECASFAECLFTPRDAPMSASARQDADSAHTDTSAPSGGPRRCGRYWQTTCTRFRRRGGERGKLTRTAMRGHRLPTRSGTSSDGFARSSQGAITALANNAGTASRCVGVSGTAQLTVASRPTACEPARSHGASPSMGLGLRDPRVRLLHRGAEGFHTTLAASHQSACSPATEQPECGAGRREISLRHDAEDALIECFPVSRDAPSCGSQGDRSRADHRVKPVLQLVLDVIARLAGSWFRVQVGDVV
jgi:hypothetical protein